MKKILLSLLVLTSTIGLQAQEKQKTENNSNKWIITAGANIVDIRTPKNLGEAFKDYLGPRDFNFSGVPLKVTVERSLNDAFSMQIGASMNKIQKGFDWDKGDFKTDILFLAFDGKLKYDLNNLFGETGRFDPFIETGFGVTEYDHHAMVNLKAGWGFNFWFTDNVGINLNSTYNHNFEKSGNDYFQHSLGLAYRFTAPNSKDSYTNQIVNESSKWLVSFGVNFLDVRTPDNFKGFFEDYFNGDIEDVNAYGFPFRVTVERKFNRGFGIQLGFSTGDFKKGYNTRRVGQHYNFKRLGVNKENFHPGYDGRPILDEKYWAVDLKGTYDLNNLIGQTAWFAPFINVGIGYSKLADKSDFKVNAGYGANFWLFENVGIKAESSYNHHFGSTGTDFFQHSAGLVYRFGGKRKDTDKDGIFDNEDECPKVPGLVAFKGCPDTDEDGIPDNDDKCPKVKGVKENNGCPWLDTDGDGITDNLDKCPKVKGPKTNNGCPEEKVEVIEEVVEEVKPDCSAEFNEINNTEVYFDFDKTALKPEAKSKLNRVAQILKTVKCSVELVFLSGYADPRGTNSYNLGLSNRRAIAVKQYLQSIGVTNVTIREQGFGETHSRKQNRFNRRVEIRIK
ncbi:MAG: OmpA family protein [Tenacibaculum sp.]|nr:OmpA family protein [Tenacibaculum sp.]